MLILQVNFTKLVTTVVITKQRRASARRPVEMRSFNFLLLQTKVVRLNSTNFIQTVSKSIHTAVYVYNKHQLLLGTNLWRISFPRRPGEVNGSRLNRLQKADDRTGSNEQLWVPTPPLSLLCATSPWACWPSANFD